MRNKTKPAARPKKAQTERTPSETPEIKIPERNKAKSISIKGSIYARNVAEISLEAPMCMSTHSPFSYLSLPERPTCTWRGFCSDSAQAPFVLQVEHAE
ncbi:MAG: hypothetical protein A2268_09515 [Candidatus Raymondbacteria bacterium RifOxyA12_full_50_37]|uniref:Uncharacterized protein n=1 Tax=Candidatus Raymondbacteria bacterium RIFOXYD12_FULL_49_13 TaxID=1817890 RepID=A0A1F7F1I5_UNCRA|nr:MAG: hypothetical protein A2268_09515 [Candidatus Raymondbacteria bacterium RifOxyA12_full_50_37]OGJ93128.1 MAG: hypothetical protein A2350_17705 [Candidatus Raymondbacteria bacterium RifOxyB12_full_50_8]OGJ98209.1 MAG: hypothetical protein A2453_00385 [Candidatus Raymondbacteria bacterium RIFOXYC2_FULL_50_21]OGK00442.1 MAG: hypothetical protein A2519_10560 [Candidatus Raymondbacteria bacterium RIFOXYD12_FULL_49_13]OGK05164.1 MAG: hypothetical protein A2487_08180 [Candidatus Raymondbacteria 